VRINGNKLYRKSRILWFGPLRVARDFVMAERAIINLLAMIL
jgi:hypothetical protein